MVNVSLLRHVADARMLLPQRSDTYRIPDWREEQGSSTGPWSSWSSHVTSFFRNTLVPPRDVHQQAESLDAAD